MDNPLIRGCSMISGSFAHKKSDTLLRIAFFIIKERHLFNLIYSNGLLKNIICTSNLETCRTVLHNQRYPAVFHRNIPTVFLERQ